MRTFVQHEGRTLRPKVWKVEVQGADVHLIWGLAGGAMQETRQKFRGVNLGKANERTPEQVAEAWAERQILLKTRRGYAEVANWVVPAGSLVATPEGSEPVEELETGDEVLADQGSASIVQLGNLELDFANPPTNLRFYKPQNSPKAHMEKMMAAGTAWYTRKRNGMMHSIWVDEQGEIRIFSSTTQPFHKDDPGVPWGHRYPHLMGYLSQCSLPPRTVLLGELVTDAQPYGVDDLAFVQQVTKSLILRALSLQEEHKPLEFVVWDIAVWDGEPLVVTHPVKDRIDLIQRVFGGSEAALIQPLLARTPQDDGYPRTQEDALQQAKAAGWEGWVVVDPDGVYGDRAYSLQGHPDRPKYSCKLKPYLEGDFIVRWDPEQGIGTWGKGKKSGGVGAVFAYLIDPETGEEKYISKIGGGLKDEDVFRLADPKLYPQVWEVEFASWTDGGSLTFPEFVRERPDKALEECTLDSVPGYPLSEE